MTPEEFGFDMERFKAPNVGTFAGGKGASVMLAPPPGVPSFKAPAIMCHLVREIPGGIEFRTRFWMGMRIIDRKAVRCIPDTVRIPDFVASLGVEYRWYLQCSTMTDVDTVAFGVPVDPRT